MTNLKTLNEEIEVVEYDSVWPNLFIQEAQNIKGVFESRRLLGIEHYGSTAVPGLSAKPIIDILIGLNEFYLSEQEKSRLQDLGYLYFGKALASQRFFLRKRGVYKFNLAIVLHKGAVWHECLTVCEFLRSHSNEVKKYSQIKKQAISEGYTNALDYSEFKKDFVVRLVKRAKLWDNGSMFLENQI